MGFSLRLSAQVACRYAVLTRCARSAAARQHTTCARPFFQLPTNVGRACYAISAMAPVTSMIGPMPFSNAMIGKTIISIALMLAVGCLPIYLYIHSVTWEIGFSRGLYWPALLHNFNIDVSWFEVLKLTWVDHLIVVGSGIITYILSSLCQKWRLTGR